MHDELNQNETQLDELFAAYRQATDEIDEPADFEAGVWSRIELGPLARLFAAYRRAFGEIEASPNFMPEIWAKIEQSRPVSWIGLIRAWSPRLAAAAAAAAILLSLSLEIQRSSRPERVLLERTYVDALTNDSMDEHDGALWTLAGYRR